MPQQRQKWYSTEDPVIEEIEKGFVVGRHLQEPPRVDYLKMGAQARRSIWEEGKCNWKGGTIV